MKLNYTQLCIFIFKYQLYKDHLTYENKESPFSLVAEKSNLCPSGLGVTHSRVWEAPIVTLHRRDAADSQTSKCKRLERYEK